MATVRLSASQSSVFNSKVPPDTIRFEKMITALHDWDIVSALNDLKLIASSQNPEDEAYFCFFKANITFCNWKQVDSTGGNTSLTVLDSAVKYFELAMSLNPSIYFNRLYLKSSQLGLDSCAAIIAQNAKMSFMNEDYLKAMNLYEKILDFNTNPVYFTSAGLTAFKLTSYPKAEKYLNRALEINSHNEKAWVVLTEVQMKRNDTLNALHTAMNALNSDSLNQTLLLNYLNVSVFFNREKESADAISRIQKIHPKNERTYSVLGNYYLSKNEFLLAEQNIIRVNQKSGNSSVMIKLYFNWYLHAVAENLLNHSSGNSKDYVMNRTEISTLIKQKIEPYKSLKSADKQVETILHFFAQEFE